MQLFTLFVDYYEVHSSYEKFPGIGHIHVLIPFFSNSLSSYSKELIISYYFTSLVLQISRLSIAIAMHNQIYMTVTCVAFSYHAFYTIISPPKQCYPSSGGRLHVKTKLPFPLALGMRIFNLFLSSSLCLPAFCSETGRHLAQFMNLKILK